jgi:hypothetical protein
MCEPKARFTPRFCSKEGGQCKKAKGFVIYGQQKYDGKKATFDEMISNNYAATQITGGDMDISCTNG